MTLELPKTADIVIVGGGVMGASTAYHLAQRGVSNIVVLERTAQFEDGATNRCAGGVRYQFGTEVNVRLSLASLPMLETFRHDVGIDPQYRKCGYLFLLTRPEEVELFKRNVAMQNDLGAGTRWLTAGEVQARVPMMDVSDVLGGTFNAEDGLCDPNSVLMGYISSARKQGVLVLNEVEVTGFKTGGGQVRRVTTTHGEIETESVIDAAGPWAGQVAEWAGLDVPIQPIRRQMITTTPLPDLPPDFPFTIDFARSLYLHREGQGILTGMSNPNQTPGFDQTVDEVWELEAMEAAMKRLPMLASAGRLSGWAGLYEVTPDAHPIFGPTPLGGFWLVAGFSGHGFMHGPVAGKLMAEFLLDGGPRTVDVSMLDLARFSEGRLIEEPNVI